MSWFNEFEWFFLVLLIMKWTVMWAVAACVAAARNSCEEYCACILTGIRNIANQPDCDCTNRVRQFREQLEGSSIYYEPVEYFSLPALIYEHPFYIVNPYGATQKKDFNDINIAHNSQPYPKHRTPTTQIEINIENIPNSHRRKEKDIHINDKKHTSIYLDIDLEPEDGARSASKNVITIDDLKLTEEILIECANLHAVLDYRKSKDSKHLNTKSQGPFAKYDHLLDDELINRINNKCSQISNIVEKSLNEIKEKRPKKTTLRMLDEVHETNKQQHSNVHMKSENIDTPAETKVQGVTSFSEENVSDFDDDTQENEHTVVIYTDNKSTELLNATELPQTVTTSTPVTSAKNDSVVSTTIYSFNTISSQKDSDVLISTNEPLEITHPSVTPTYSANEYAFDTETAKLLTTAETLPTYTVAIINTVDEDITQNHQSNHMITDLSTKPQFNMQREEKDVPLLKIITHEFNNSIESYINGTEGTPNTEFEDGINNDTHNSSTQKTEVSSNDAGKITERVDESTKLDAPEISGHLYFLYNQHHIPAKFVQKPTGSLHLGIDSASLCDKLTQDDKNKSALIKTLCDCYKSNNCITNN